MRLLVDENLSPKLARALRAQGHDTVHVADRGLLAVDDRAIHGVAVAEGRSIVTRDAGFAARHVASGDTSIGVVYLPQGAAPNRPGPQLALLRRHEAAMQTRLARGEAVRLDRLGPTRIEPAHAPTPATRTASALPPPARQRERRRPNPHGRPC